MNGDNDRKVSSIVHDLFGDVTGIIRSEVALFKSEVKTETGHVIAIMPVVVAGGVLALYSGALLVTAILLALGIVMPYWVAALILFALTGIIGSALLSLGIARLRSIRAVPKTIHTMKENAEWLSSQVK
jgi:Putative Actinobacterial Holin-X, holin superfamily III